MLRIQDFLQDVPFLEILVIARILLDGYQTVPALDIAFVIT